MRGKSRIAMIAPAVLLCACVVTELTGYAIVYSLKDGNVGLVPMTSLGCGNGYGYEGQPDGKGGHLCPEPEAIC